MLFILQTEPSPPSVSFVFDSMLACVLTGFIWSPRALFSPPLVVVVVLTWMLQSKQRAGGILGILQLQLTWTDASLSVNRFCYFSVLILSGATEPTWFNHLKNLIDFTVFTTFSCPLGFFFQTQTGWYHTCTVCYGVCQSFGTKWYSPVNKTQLCTEIV